MNGQVRDRLIHVLLALLLSVGLLMPLLGILDPSLMSTEVLLWVAVLIVILELLNLRPVFAVIFAVIAAIGLTVWLVSTNQANYIEDVFHAVSLRFMGIDTSLAMVSSYVVIVLTGLVTVLCFFSSSREVPVLWTASFCFAMILLIYLTGSDSLIPWFIPALYVLLVQLLASRFGETPLLPLLPLGALLVVAAFLLSRVSPGSEPLQQKVDEIRQAVMDRIFFTDPRDVFSLSSEGYYPEGQDQLGGKPDPDDDPVMQVSTPRTTYLRGVILNEYTGRNWINTTGGRRFLRQSLRPGSERASLFDENLPPETVRNTLCDPVTVSVRMLSDSASTLFVPQRVRDLAPGGDLVPYYSNSSELFVTRNLKAGDTYSVSAPLFTAGDSGLNTLIEVCSTLNDNQYDQISRTYTVLPSHLEQPVYDLALEISSIASSPYDKALALQSWLSRSCRYTLEVDNQPANEDFVTRFLLETKEGYCTYFASAMTVLCRMAGLPARYIEGYLAEPDENGEALVTGLSAHAWTEVYFKGFGWLTFDATPRRSASENPGTGSDSSSQSPPDDDTTRPESFDPDLSSEEPSPPPAEQSTPAPEQESELSPDLSSPVPSEHPDSGLSSTPPDNSADSDDSSADAGSFPWLWLLLLILFLAAVLRVILTAPSFRAHRARSESERFDIWAQELTDLLQSENLNRQAGESPMAFGRRIDSIACFNVTMNPAGECISLIRYSSAGVKDTDTNLIRDISILLKSELSRPARLRYYLRRFFVPVSHRDSL